MLGLFRKIFWRRKTQKPSRPLAMVTFNDDVRLNPEAIAHVLEQRYAIDSTSIQAEMVHSDKSRSAEDAVLMAIEMGGVNGFVGLVRAPIPWSDLEGPCETAWWWPEATETMRPHTAHTLVSLLTSTNDIFYDHLMVTKLVAAVCETNAASGVYWGSGGLVYQPDLFVKQSRKASMEELPFHLWIDCRIQRISKTHTQLLTTGMNAFGKPEIEIMPVPVKPSELLEFAHNIINYVLTGGDMFKTGHTIGRSEEEKYRIKYTKSLWDRPEKVMRLEL